jgi:cyclopropane-fatty-acyl-phospholipid synthase
MNDQTSSASLDSKSSGVSRFGIRERMVLRLLESIELGELDLTLPDGSSRRYVGRANSASVAPEHRAQITIHDPQALSLAVSRGDIGFGEGYMQGLWSTSNLSHLLRVMVINREVMSTLIYGRWWSTLIDQVRHLMRSNRRKQARKNISAHYDLGNDFYKLWLDPSMTYSSALFDDQIASGQRLNLQEGQHRKIDRAIASLSLERLDDVEEPKVLEIGCGWGGLAEIAIRDMGALVTGITLSPAQLAYATERLHAQSMHADLRLQDYRDTNDGPYDAICSIEMIEAVGRDYWPTYFQTIARLLKPGGQACIQSIVIDDALFERYAMGTDFIQQYIFPGGFLPSTSAFKAQAQAAGLQVIDEFAFGQDYAETLRRWRVAFLQVQADLPALGFDKVFERTWLFYLAYCEAAFAERNTDVVQFTLRKPA